MEPEILTERGNTYFLLVCIVRGVVEKYGGSLKIDEKTNGIILCIPEDRETECLWELKKTVDPKKPIKDFSPFFACDPTPESS